MLSIFCKFSTNTSDTIDINFTSSLKYVMTWLNIIIFHSYSLKNRTICNLIFLSWCWQIKCSNKTHREKHSQLWAAILKLTKKTNNILGQFVIFCVNMSIFVTVRMILYLGWSTWWRMKMISMNLYEREDERLKDSGMFGQL